MSQVPEESYTLAQYRNTFKKRFEFTAITVLGSDANGTHFQWDDAFGERHFGVISDLFTGILRRGENTVNIPANTISGFLSVTLSPALTGAASDYLLFATSRGSTTVTSVATLTSLSVLRLTCARTLVAHTHNVLTESIDVDLVTGLGPSANVATSSLFLSLSAFDQLVDWFIIRA